MAKAKKTIKNLEIEQSFAPKIIAGIDEAGRGPLAGEVVSAICFLDAKIMQKDEILAIDDSKKITKKKRRFLYEFLQKNAKFGVGIVDAKTIDKINILQATKLSMFRAYENFVAKYQIFPQIILVDGNFSPFSPQDKIEKILPIIKGDQKSLSIAAASIIAKEFRDDLMQNHHQNFPNYNFAQNAGYGTKQHLQALQNFGPCQIHRQSFSPVAKVAKKSV